jgi:hypothetical protein
VGFGIYRRLPALEEDGDSDRKEKNKKGQAASGAPRPES